MTTRSRNKKSKRYGYFTAAVLLVAVVTQPVMAEGEDAPPTLESLRSLMQQGEYAEAVAAAEVVLARLETEMGPDSPQVAEVLDVLLESRWRSGKATDPETRAIGERALDIKQRVLGPADAGVGKTMHHLAILAFFRGEYAPAIDLWKQAITIRAGALGADHADVAESTNGLANVLQRTGDYATARDLYGRTLRIREAVHGPDHPRVAQTLNNLSVLLYELGEYAEAIELGERSLKIKEQALGQEHPQVAMSLINLEQAYNRAGDRERARAVGERAVEVSTKAFGEEHPRVGAALNNLANQARRDGDYDRARKLYDQALAVWEKAYGPEHPRVATVLNSLSLLLEATGDLDGAKAILERCVSNYEQGLGTEHPFYADALHNLSGLLTKMGQNESARSGFDRAVTIRRESLGAGHPMVAASQIGLARVDAQVGKTQDALGLALESERIARDHLRLTGSSLAEEQALRYAASRESGLDLALSLVTTRDTTKGSASPVYDALIRSRAVVLDEMASRNRTVSQSGDPRILRLAAELDLARKRLANLTVRGLGGLSPEAYRTLVDEARRDKELAERALGEASSEFAREQRKSRLGLDDVAAHLPDGSALVSFTLYDHIPFAASSSASGEESKSVPPGEPVTSYAALILRGDGKPPTVLRLGDAAEIDALVSRWKKEASAGMRSIRRSAAESEQAYRDVGDELRRRIWDPLARGLAGVKRVFVVPDGGLNMVSLAALPMKEDAYLIETGPALHYLSAERDLVTTPDSASPGRGLLALGGPAYDDTSMFAALSSEEPSGKEAPAAGQEASTRSASCASFGSLKFKPLPAALQEAREISTLWDDAAGEASGEADGVVHLSGASASEAAFKRSSPGRKVLHIATHGFFLGGDCLAGDGSRGFSVVKKSKPEPLPAPVAVSSPLLLSGLALAGANHRDAAAASEEDGVLTAEELASLDLSGVEWAVLSACDTGVGEIQAGEGVFGLRRAVQVAGVRTLIMSLWPVDDEATRQWMNALYRGRLSEGLDSVAAVRNAGLTVLRARRQSGEPTHPFYWAAFVATGDWH